MIPPPENLIYLILSIFPHNISRIGHTLPQNSLSELSAIMVANSASDIVGEHDTNK